MAPPSNSDATQKTPGHSSPEHGSECAPSPQDMPLAHTHENEALNVPQINNDGWPESMSEASIRLEVNLDASPEETEVKNSQNDTDMKVLEDYQKAIEQRTAYHFGYPYNLAYDHDEVLGFLRYSINNLGDPFEPSNYAVHSRPFELAVIDFFARLWKIEKPDYWGYVTTSGTEGNLQGILLAREALPDGILYASRESHYSVFKAARFYRMDTISVDTMHTGEIDYHQLEQKISENLDRPVILNVNIGTTVKGAVDDLNRVLRILDSLNVSRDRYFVHCDGALFALMLPFVKYSPEVSFALPLDSISVSGHKFLGCPMPCGVIVTRKEHVERLQSNIEYLSSKDTTIMGSRNGQSPLFLWYTLRKKGCAGLLTDVRKCLENARYLRDELKQAGISCMLNDLSTTVVFERPHDLDFVKRWQLACENNIAHVVVMPNITRVKIDTFIVDLVKSREAYAANNALSIASSDAASVTSSVSTNNRLSPTNRSSSVPNLTALLSANAALSLTSPQALSLPVTLPSPFTSSTDSPPSTTPTTSSVAQRCVKSDIGPFCLCESCVVNRKCC